MNRGWRNGMVWLLGLVPILSGFVYTAAEMKVNVLLFLLSPLFSIIVDFTIAQERARRPQPERFGERRFDA